MSYNNIVKQHFFNPINLLAKDDKEDEFISISLGSSDIGDAIKLYLQCDPETQVIKKFKYRVYGNPYLIAVLSYCSGQLIGKSLADDLLSTQHLINELELPQTKYYCAYMFEDALQQVITKWREYYV